MKAVLARVPPPHKPCRKAAAVQRISFKSSVLCTRGREASSAGTCHALSRERSSFSPSLQQARPESYETQRREGREC